MITVKALGDSTAEIMIYEQIGADFWSGGGVTAKAVADDLKALGNVANINVRINSPGGNVFDGIAIYNLLKSHPAQVHVMVDGMALSIASVIAMAGDLITMADNALMMIHDPSTMVDGNATQMRATADVLDQVKAAMMTSYVTRSGMSEDDVSALMSAETWFTAAQARDAKLADVVTPAVDVTAKFDLSHFRNSAKVIPVPATRQTPNEEIAPMAEQNQTVAPTEIENIKAQARAEALKAESNRRAEISAVFATANFATDHAALLAEALGDMSCTADQARTKLLAKLGEGVTPTGTARVEAGQDAGEKFIAGASAALLARSGIQKREAGNEFNGMSLVDIARASLSRAGVSVKGMNADEVARRVTAPVMALSTSDFPSLLANTANKMLRTAYELYPNTYDKWCWQSEVSDFKQNSRIQLGSFNSLDTIPEGGEYQYGNFVDDKSTIQAATKGKALLLTRQAIVNDDLGGFSRRAAMMGRAAARTVNADAYGVLTANAAMGDGVAIFHATHKNLAGSGAVISVTTLSAARNAMRKQQDKSSRDTLNIAPALLLTPVAIQDTAAVLMRSITDPASSNANVPNVFQNAFEVVSDPVLDAASATAWYLLASPGDCPLVEVAFLNGERTPFIDNMIDWDTDAFKFKVRLDYGVAAIDFRGGYKNPGA